MVVKHKHILKFNDVFFLPSNQEISSLEERFVSVLESDDRILNILKAEIKVVDSLIPFRDNTLDSIEVEYVATEELLKSVSEILLIWGLSEALKPYYDFPIYDSLKDIAETVEFETITEEEPPEQTTRIVLKDNSWLRFVFHIKPSKDLNSLTDIYAEFLKIVKEMYDFAHENFNWVISEYILPEFTTENNVVVSSLVEGYEYTMDFALKFSKISGELTVRTKPGPDYALNVYSFLSSKDSVFKPTSGVLMQVSESDVHKPYKLAKKVSDTTDGYFEYTFILKKAVSRDELESRLVKLYEEISDNVRKESDKQWVTDLLKVEIDSPKSEFKKHEEVKVRIYLRFIKIKANAPPLMFLVNERQPVQGIVTWVIVIAIGVLTYLIMGEIIDVIKEVQLVFKESGLDLTASIVTIAMALFVILFVIFLIKGT